MKKIENYKPFELYAVMIDKDLEEITTTIHNYDPMKRETIVKMMCIGIPVNEKYPIPYTIQEIKTYIHAREREYYKTLLEIHKNRGILKYINKIKVKKSHKNIEKLPQWVKDAVISDITINGCCDKDVDYKNTNNKLQRLVFKIIRKMYIFFEKRYLNRIIL